MSKNTIKYRKRTNKRGFCVKNIVRLANKFILLRGIDRLPLDMERLRTLCAAEELVLLSYGEAEELINALALQPHTVRNAFLLHTKDVGLVLYKDTLPLGKKLFAVAHELGHHFLGHTFYGICEQNFANNAQEREADAFALHILAPLCVLREQHLRTVGEIQAETLLDREHAALALQQLRRYRRADRLDTDVLAQFGLTRNPRENILEKRLKVIVPLLTSLLIFMGGLFHLHLFTYKKPYSDTETNTCAMDIPGVPKPEKAATVRCRNGFYHRPFCPLYQAGDLALTEEEALCMGFLPCDDCRTDKRYKGD